MNREIKFRAWDKAHNKMCYEVNLYTIASKGRLNKAQLNHKSFMNTIGLDCEIMQFSGQNDKNGVEIYEGDIVNFETNFGDKVTAPVIFENSMFCVIWEDNLEAIANICYPEVIGNIYDHPQLIKQ